jgi:pimeloyl-ACP methyl ester carboxylesterase
MKKLILILVVLSIQKLQSQDITGDWYGALKTGSSQLRLNLHFTKTDTGYTGKLISLDQNNTPLPLQWVKFSQRELSFKTTMANIEYAGVLKDSLIDGTFKQNGRSLPLQLGRAKIEKTTIAKRPQEPKAPFPYISEEISFLNAKDNITLAGTLTLPAAEGRFPIVVLISGSGPQDRNEELMGHKPFWVLADHLTKNGFAVLRYDDRGIAKSKGNFKGASSADFARDVMAAVSYLKTRKEIDPKKIGLIGHSEGGLIAPMVAAQSKDIAYMVLLAGPGVPGKDIIQLQGELIARSMGASEPDIKASGDIMNELMAVVTSGKDSSVINNEFKTTLTRLYRNLPDSVKKGLPETVFQNQYAALNEPWMKYFLAYDPATSLHKIKIPVLALNGSLDLQVSPSQNLPMIKQALDKAGNKKYLIKELPGLNHLFQEAKIGLPAEYADIEQTLSPVMLKEMTDWLKAL